MKHIYIIEDELKDLGDLLITLHAIIYSTKYKLNPKETKIHLIEIQWENEEIRKVEYDAEINKLCTRLTDCNIEIIEIEHKIVKMADIPDYEKRCSEFARIIYDTIGDFTPLYDEALTSTSIPSCRDGEKYVVMLDLILRTGKSRDEALCQARKKITSHYLYKVFGDERTILYSEYPPASVCSAWLDTAEIPGDERGGKIISRQHIAKAAAIYLPLVRRLQAALCV